MTYSRSPKRPFGPNERYLWNREPEIRAAVKAFWSGNTFSFPDIAETGRLTSSSLRTSGMTRSKVSAALHSNWAGIDTDRLSAACVYEHFFNRFVAFGPLYSELLPYFEQDTSPAHFVTRARDRDRLPIARVGELKRPSHYIRPVADAIRSLSKDGQDVKAVTVMELSFGKDLDGEEFAEPHTHSLVFGVGADDLRAAFRGSRSVDKNQLRVDFIKDLHERVSYMVKSKPELRVKYIGPKGRDGRRDNRAHPDLRTLWWRYQAANCMSDVLTYSCFSQGFVKRVRSCTLEECVSEMLKNGAMIASRRPSAR